MGGSSRDEVLRKSLVGFANETIAELDRESRWSLSYSEMQINTSNGVSAYKLTVPSGSLGASGFEFDRIARVYYLDENNKMKRLHRLNREDLQRLYTEGSPPTSPITQAPIRYAIEYTPFDASGYTTLGGFFTGTSNQDNEQAKQFFPYTLFLYPTPDNSGPNGGSYPLRIGGYYNTPYIVETTGTTTVTPPNEQILTVPSVQYLYRNLVPSNGQNQKATVSVRNAGDLMNSAADRDTLISSWASMDGGSNTVTMDTNAPAVVTNGQVFFHSTNWMIRYWPKLIQFGMLREIAQYYGNDAEFALWDKRFDQQLDKMRNWDADRARGRELMAAGLLGGNATALNRSDMLTGWGDFGGGW